MQENTIKTIVDSAKLLFKHDENTRAEALVYALYFELNNGDFAFPKEIIYTAVNQSIAKDEEQFGCDFTALVISQLNN